MPGYNVVVFGEPLAVGIAQGEYRVEVGHAKLRRQRLEMKRPAGEDVDGVDILLAGLRERSVDDVTAATPVGIRSRLFVVLRPVGQLDGGAIGDPARSGRPNAP